MWYSRWNHRKLNRELIEGLIENGLGHLAGNKGRMEKADTLTEPEFENGGNKNQFSHQRAIWENMEKTGKND